MSEKLVSEQNIHKWKCSKCGQVTEEPMSMYHGKPAGYEPYPESGWGCRNLNCRVGRRYLVK